MMMPLPQHIILKKKNKATQVWLSQSYLVEAIGVSADYLRTNHSKLQAWSRECFNGYYFEYFSIPDKAPKHYRSQLPTYEDLIAIKKEGSKLTADFESYFEAALADTDNFTRHYMLVEKTKRDELALAASIVMHTAAYVNETGYNTKKHALYEQLTKLLSDYNISYLPKSRRIKEPIMMALAGKPINEIVYLPRTGNNNAARFKDDAEIEAWIYDLASNPKNFSNAYICRQISNLCAITGKLAPSDETIQLKLRNRQVRFITGPSRFGKGTREAAAYEGSIPVANVPFAGDNWQMDATRVNLIAYEKIIVAPDGKRIKSLQNLMSCVVRDTYSGASLGYSYGESESADMYINALKMAVETAGYLPYELVADKFPGHNTPKVIEFMESIQALGVKLTVSHKATGKAQLERFWSTIQQVEMQGHDYYYGEGIKSKRAHAHVSPEHLAAVKKQAKKDGFDYVDTINIYTGMLEAHNNRNYSDYSRKYPKLAKSPMQLHNESDKPNVINLCAQQINHIFGIKTDVKIDGNGLIKIQFNQVQHYFLIEKTDVILQYDRVCASYNPEDLDSVEIYARIKGSTWLKHLCTAKSWQPVQIYGPQAEFNKLAAMKRRQREINDIRKQKLEEKTKPVLTLSNEEPEVYENYNAEEEVLMGAYTYKKAAGGYEDIELNPEDPRRSIYNQLFNQNS
jgi:hypothetical protein